VPFDILQEPWSEYRLSDGTTLKTRFVLLKVWDDAETREGQKFGKLSNQIVNVIQAPARLIGPKGSSASVQELQQNIVDSNVKIEPIVEKPSVYMLSDKRFLIVQTRAIAVSRTSLFDAEGAPHYLVTSQTAVSSTQLPETTSPEAISKTLQSGSTSRRRNKAVKQ